MSGSLSSWWRNCAIEPDEEILQIDRMEDEIAPLGPEITRVRELISTLELCHHKAERWVFNIIEAIGAGDTQKGLGTRSAGQTHPVERVWQSACDALSAWCAGCPAGSVDMAVGTARACDLLAGIGKRSPLKEWQVQRVIDKIRSHVHWAPDASSAEYAWLLLAVDEHGVGYHSQCPECFKEHEEFWRATAKTIICNTEDGNPQRLSLGIAIDMLWPCHWRFVKNLQVVLAAIGGQLEPEEPFTSCVSDIPPSPLRARMETISGTLRAFCYDAESDENVDREILARLGEPTEAKKWLAGSLAKTISLQLNPTAAMREASDLTGPEWIHQ
jgi:hypothetical protein